MKHLTRSSLAGSFALAFVGSMVFAQEPIRLRGTIERIEGPIFVLKTRYGAQVKLTIADSPELIAAVKSSITDIKLGTFIGSIAKLQPDGTQRATEVHIFPDSMRTITEDLSRDLTSQNQITNANVENIVAGADGHLLTVKDKHGEKKLLVSMDAPIVTFVSGDKSDLKAGVAIFVPDAKKEPGGLLQTSVIIYGRDGLAPPL